MVDKHGILDPKGGIPADDTLLKKSQTGTLGLFLRGGKSNFKLEFLGILILLVLWFIAGWCFTLFSANDSNQFGNFFPVPTFKALYQLVLEGRFWVSVVASMERV
ncbi:MAG: hypothetical protein HQK61_09850, partial [Desulfamplus sp.]|nr:hypothetical protein [Desulfamplus sp.]